MGVEMDRQREKLLNQVKAQNQSIDHVVYREARVHLNGEYTKASLVAIIEDMDSWPKREL